MKIEHVDDLTDAACRKYLKELIQELDDLDEDDFFGTEGWRHRLGLED